MSAARQLSTYPHRARGFTLIELIAVITILAILLTIGVPNFVNLIASQRVQTASADLYTSLLRARAEAIKQNADVTVAKVGSWHMSAPTGPMRPSASQYPGCRNRK